MMPRIPRKYIPVLSTIAVFLLLYGLSCWHDRLFSKPEVLWNILRDNAALGVISVGMTFVILSGGIDLSVGSVLALSTVVIGILVNNHGLHPLAAMAVALVMGTSLGALMGCFVRFYDLPPFIVTLGGMFFARGTALLINAVPFGIKHGFYTDVQPWILPLVFLLVVGVGIFVAAQTAFGRNVYAVGGNEEASKLMGIPVGRTKIAIYALSGFCAALGGVLQTLSTAGSKAEAGMGFELDAIASVVVGGTLLSGGVGYVFGTFIGVLILGTLEEVINNRINLNVGWSRISMGGLLLFFIVLQKFLARPSKREG